MAMMDALFQYGCEIHHPDCLHAAVSYGHPDEVHYLLKQELDVNGVTFLDMGNFPTEGKATALHRAAQETTKR